MTPEQIMKDGFDSFFNAVKCFKKAVPLYKKRNDQSKADPENVVNLNKSILLMNQAYDEISAIWENDINI